MLKPSQTTKAKVTPQQFCTCMLIQPENRWVMCPYCEDEYAFWINSLEGQAAYEDALTVAAQPWTGDIQEVA
jgi:hypothetical protein